MSHGAENAPRLMPSVRRLELDYRNACCWSRKGSQVFTTPTRVSRRRLAEEEQSYGFYEAGLSQEQRNRGCGADHVQPKARHSSGPATAASHAESHGVDGVFRSEVSDLSSTARRSWS